MKKSVRRLQLNRETLHRLDENLHWVQGAATGTCLGSGCEECKTLRSCPVVVDPTPVTVLPAEPVTA